MQVPPLGREIPWEGNGYPLQVFLPGKSHGQRSLVDYSPWGCRESERTGRLNNNNSNLVYKERQVLYFSYQSLGLPSLGGGGACGVVGRRGHTFCTVLLTSPLGLRAAPTIPASALPPPQAWAVIGGCSVSARGGRPWIQAAACQGHPSWAEA